MQSVRSVVLMQHQLYATPPGSFLMEAVYTDYLRQTFRCPLMFTPSGSMRATRLRRRTRKPMPTDRGTNRSQEEPAIRREELRMIWMMRMSIATMDTEGRALWTMMTTIKATTCTLSAIWGIQGVHMYGERDQRASGVSGQKQSSFKTLAFILLYFDRLFGLLSSTRGYLRKSNLQRIDGCTISGCGIEIPCTIVAYILLISQNR